MAKVFHVKDSTIVSFGGEGLRNGIEECRFTVTATEGDASSGTFGVHLVCTTSQYTHELDYYRDAPETLITGSVAVHGHS